MYIRDDIVSSVVALDSHSHGTIELLMVKIKKKEKTVILDLIFVNNG